MGTVLGLRCSNNEYSFVIITGTAQKPIIVEKNAVSFPRQYSRPQSLKWFQQEIEDILKKHTINVIAIKKTEGLAARGKPFVERTENEAIVQLVAANAGIKHVLFKVKATISKDFGFKGKAKYLTSINMSPIPDFDKETDKMKEAILVAWSTIK